MKQFAAGAAFVALLAPGAAAAHAALRSADPPAGSTLVSAPTQLRLQFNEPLEGAFSSVKLLRADGSEVAVGKPRVEAADASKLVLPLPPLAPGVYKARWSTMGHDGHRMRGEFGFTVQQR